MQAWAFSEEELDARTRRYQIFENGKVLSFSQVAHYWRTDADFVTFYNRILTAAPFRAFFWEHPPLRANLLDQTDYEFVLVDSPALAGVEAEPGPFRACFSDALAVRFPNLGGDAQLVAPSPQEGCSFPHLAAFARQAGNDQLQAFWSAVGGLFVGWNTPENRWLSTSGLGVYWLHVRWDLRPKYYTHLPYLRAAV